MIVTVGEGRRDKSCGHLPAWVRIPSPNRSVGAARAALTRPPWRGTFQARLPQDGDDIGPVPHRAVLDTLEQVVPDQVAGLGLKPETGRSRAASK